MTELPWSDPQITRIVNKITSILKSQKIEPSLSSTRITSLNGDIVDYIKFLGTINGKIKIGISWNTRTDHIELRITLYDIDEGREELVDLLEDMGAHIDFINENMYITKKVPLSKLDEVENIISEVISFLRES